MRKKMFSAVFLIGILLCKSCNQTEVEPSLIEFPATFSVEVNNQIWEAQGVLGNLHSLENNLSNKDWGSALNAKVKNSAGEIRENLTIPINSNIIGDTQRIGMVNPPAHFATLIGDGDILQNFWRASDESGFLVLTEYNSGKLLIRFEVDLIAQGELSTNARFTEDTLRLRNGVVEVDYQESWPRLKLQ